ncbi:MAG: hypothetical protein LBV22_01145 [Mycoplasmataceae bacterium]|nr:hypothetical protein [Mycoplasmataceae bacterium]
MANAALSQKLTPSSTLAKIIGSSTVTRGEAVKKLWDYFKKNDLQDKKNKRNINADAALLPLFGKKQITMFEVGGILAKNLK